MDSDNSRSINIKNTNDIKNELINNVSKSKDGNDSSINKKLETSDTDYYLGLLANKNKLNDDSDNKSDYSSDVSEIINSDSDDSDDEKSEEKQSRASSPRSTERSSDSESSRKRSDRSEVSNTDRRKFEPLNYQNRAPAPPVHEQKMKKIELLRKLSELKTKGYDLSKNYDFNSSIEEMEYEYELLKSFANKRNGIKLFKSCLCNAVSVVEMMDDKYDPFDFHLTGWSEHMSVEVDSYEEVLEELYEKYKGTGKQMAPEVKLFLLISASASAFHFSKSTFKNLPGVDQAMKNNPDLVARFINPKKEPSQFMTQQEIHLEKQRQIAIERERMMRNRKEEDDKRKSAQRERSPPISRVEQSVPAPGPVPTPVPTPAPVPMPVNQVSPVSDLNLSSMNQEFDQPQKRVNIKAPTNVQNILNRVNLENSNYNQNTRIQRDMNDEFPSTLGSESYVSNNSETQESSSVNNDRILSNSSARGGRKKKSIMTVL